MGRRSASSEHPLDPVPVAAVLPRHRAGRGCNDLGRDKRFMRKKFSFRLVLVQNASFSEVCEGKSKAFLFSPFLIFVNQLDPVLFVSLLEGGSHGVEYRPHLGVAALEVLSGDGTGVVPAVVTHILFAVKGSRIG